MAAIINRGKKGIWWLKYCVAGKQVYHSLRTTNATLFCSTRTIARWKKRFEAGGWEALLGKGRGRWSSYARWLMTLVVTWVTTRLPRDHSPASAGCMLE